MVDLRKKYAQFASWGRRIRRNNPGAYTTMPSADRLLGFNGVIDITGVIDAQNKAILAVKLNTQDWQEKEIDFSSATPEALTVDAAVTALNAAGFAGVTFEKDTVSMRLNMKASSIVTFPISWIDDGKPRTILMYKTETQIYGDLAGALDFGQGRANGGKGSYWMSDWQDFDIAYSFTNDRQESQDIDTTGARGRVIRMSVGAKTLGVSFDLTSDVQDDDLTLVVAGGAIATGDDTNYKNLLVPPSSERSEYPTFTTEIFLPQYIPGTNSIGQIAQMKRRIFSACSGYDGDVPTEAMAWATASWHITARDGHDENGEIIPSSLNPVYSKDQFDSYDFQNI
jgi:hypothetical protein